jgi:heme O synthase-like polyprenyltransferase
MSENRMGPPATQETPMLRERLRCVVTGSLFGVLVALVGWFAAEDGAWIWAIPLGALFGLQASD